MRKPTPTLRLCFINWVFLWLLALCLPNGTAWAEGRVALVIGNSAYQNVGALVNAERDATDISAALSDLGFRVISGYDLSRAQMLELAQNFQAQLHPGDVALFFFAGHGVQIGAENYIIPVDARGDTSDDIRNSSVSLQTILAEMQQKASRNIVILDACRNNPFQLSQKARALGGISRGLARVDAGVGSFIAFSTQPGNIALDGQGRNSPFTAALLHHLPTSDADLHAVMRKVRKDVIAATSSQQIPWENSSLINEIYLAAPYGNTPAAQPVANPPTVAPLIVQPPIAQLQFDHKVFGVGYGGDGFLALRADGRAGAKLITKMPEGTLLHVLGRQGSWFHVQTEAGQQGWAHSNWIRSVGVATQTKPPENCQSLWYERNAIFARRGYCFSSAKGQAAFSNAGCLTGASVNDLPLTQADRQQVKKLQAREKALGCY